MDSWLFVTLFCCDPYLAAGPFLLVLAQKHQGSDLLCSRRTPGPEADQKHPETPTCRNFRSRLMTVKTSGNGQIKAWCHLEEYAQFKRRVRAQEAEEQIPLISRTLKQPFPSQRKHTTSQRAKDHWEATALLNVTSLALLPGSLCNLNFNFFLNIPSAAELKSDENLCFHLKFSTLPCHRGKHRWQSSSSATGMLPTLCSFLLIFEGPIQPSLLCYVWQ